MLSALAHAHRLQVFRLLVKAGPGGRPAGDLGEALGLPPATLSFHLKELTRAGLLRSRPAGRFIYYTANFDAMAQLVGYLTENCCQGHPEACFPKTSENPVEPRSHSPLQVLFLCTGNSARSILAEAILNAMGKGRFQAHSAGSHPAGRVNPFALELLQRNRLPTEGLRSKNWEEFSAPGAPALDFVFTVCDNAAGEVCPVWPGQPLTAHWGIPDPAAVEGSDEQRRHAFFVAFTQLQNRISLFVNLPLEKLDRLSLQAKLEEIGAQARNRPQ